MNDKQAREISALVNHPAWLSLTEVVEAENDKYWKAMAERLQVKGVVIDQSELDFMRGRFNAAKLLLKQPARAVRLLAEAETKRKSAKQREETPLP